VKEFGHKEQYDGLSEEYELAGIAQSVYRRATGWTSGVGLPAGARFLFSLQRPDWIWGPPSPLSNGYRELFPWGKAAEASS
jgi:hypothetical protein